MILDNTNRLRRVSLLDMGMSNLSFSTLWRLVRAFLERLKTDSLLRNSLFIMTTSGLASVLGYVSTFLISIPLWTASTLVDAVFTAERVAGNMLVRNMILSVFKLILLVVLIPFNWGGYGIFFSWIAATVISMVAALDLIRRL